MPWTIKYLVFVIVFYFSFPVFSQVPQAINYQAVLRDSTGESVAEMAIGLEISLLKGSMDGIPVYIETHTDTTDHYGFFSICIGMGEVLHGDFSSVVWWNDAYFLQVAADLEGGANYTELSTTQILSLPYSFNTATNAAIHIMTSAQRDTLTNPPEGMIIFNPEISKLQILVGIHWYSQDSIYECRPRPDAGEGQSLFAGETANLQGNIPDYGTGIWSVVSGDGGVIADSLDPFSSFQGDSCSTYTLRWEIRNPCDTIGDQVSIRFDRRSVANAGIDQYLYSDSMNFMTVLTGNGYDPDHETGEWNIIEGWGGIIADSADPTSSFTGVVTHKYRLRWTITNPCGISYDDVYIIPFSTCGDIVDERDGKTYQTIRAGLYCWMKQNLNVGTQIDGEEDQTDNGLIEKYCYDDLEANCDVYGGLYQWEELMNYTPPPLFEGICPEGWLVPMDEAWNELVSYIGTASTAGGKMKEPGTAHWSPPNAYATNESGFSGLGGGYGGVGGNYVSLGYFTYFWSATDNINDMVWFRSLSHTSAALTRNQVQKEDAMYVRCWKADY